MISFAVRGVAVEVWCRSGKLHLTIFPKPGWCNLQSPLLQLLSLHQYESYGQHSMTGCNPVSAEPSEPCLQHSSLTTGYHLLDGTVGLAPFPWLLHMPIMLSLDKALYLIDSSSSAQLFCLWTLQHQFDHWWLRCRINSNVTDGNVPRWIILDCPIYCQFTHAEESKKACTAHCPKHDDIVFMSSL